ncbi:GAF and ANTAR domain-containing protein [Actinomycetospora sp.]|uniref:GAF and ANTAR domain-containing protein n=1 Tax=Actinomycetospora sp. TaxID=1872135 RepID=UPI002F3F164C
MKDDEQLALPVCLPRSGEIPMSNGRELQIIDTFLSVTDTLVREFDALDMLTMLAERSVELLGVTAAGVILTDGNGDGLSVAAASSERARLLELFAVAIDAGPCVDCLHSGEAVVSEDLRSETARLRWPRFAAGAEEAEFQAAHALPMRHRNQVIGVLTLLATEPHTLDEPDVRLGQALADAATIGLLHERAVRQAETVAEQLQGALTSRVIIEQAKGMIANQADTSPDEAFSVLRAHARSHGLRLTELARSVVEGSVDLTSTTSVLPSAL